MTTSLTTPELIGLAAVTLLALALIIREGRDAWRNWNETRRDGTEP